MLGLKSWGELAAGPLRVSQDLGSNNSPLPTLQPLENERETFSQPCQWLFHQISVIQPPAISVQTSQIFEDIHTLLGLGLGEETRATAILLGNRFPSQKKKKNNQLNPKRYI